VSFSIQIYNRFIRFIILGILSGVFRIDQGISRRAESLVDTCCI